MHGILLVDKPEGMTSNDVVRLVKRWVRPSKVGHSGTLDPAASGLMLILIGAGTRSLDYLDESRKAYSMVVRLGEETDTGDRDGTVVSTADPSGITLNMIRETLDSYIGVVEQVPPHHSAIKKDGVPLYKLARKGIFPEVAPRKVEIHSLVAHSWEPPLLNLDMVCSRGTYARSVARDLGRDLNVGGRLESLRRTGSGRFRVEDALSVDEFRAGQAELVAERLISVSGALAHIPDLPALAGEVRRLMRGSEAVIPRSRLPISGGTSDAPMLFKIVSGNNGLVILVRPEPRGTDVAIRPVKVFNTLGV